MALTSAVFESWRALYALLQDADFGALPANPSGTEVHFGWPDTSATLGMENVILVGGIVTPANQDPVTFGPGRRSEQFGLIVFATVDVPGTSADQVLDRLEQIGAAVEVAVRVTSAQKPSIDGRLVPGVNWWGVASLKPLIVGGHNGHRGQLEIVVTVQAHI